MINLEVLKNKLWKVRNACLTTLFCSRLILAPLSNTEADVGKTLIQLLSKLRRMNLKKHLQIKAEVFDWSILQNQANAMANFDKG